MTDTATDDELLKSLIGTPTAKSKVVVERGPVTFFADAVLSSSPIYHDPGAARAADLADIPAPPTYAIALDSWGKFPEIQPPDAPDASAMAGVLGPLMAKGGLILHGEQEFTYHRPLVVGDVLEGEGSVVDAYRKESKGRVMTFIVTETIWRDASTGDPVVTSRFNIIHRL